MLTPATAAAVAKEAWEIEDLLKMMIEDRLESVV
jgi:hypothetical protein